MGIVPSTLVRALLLLTVLCGIALAQAQPDDGLHYSPQRERMAIELRTRTQALHFIAAGWDIAVLLLLMRWQVARKLRDRTRSTSPSPRACRDLIHRCSADRDVPAYAGAALRAVDTKLAVVVLGLD